MENMPNTWCKTAPLVSDAYVPNAYTIHGMYEHEHVECMYTNTVFLSNRLLLDPNTSR